jgi:hypothetical protein
LLFVLGGLLVTVAGGVLYVPSPIRAGEQATASSQDRNATVEMKNGTMTLTADGTLTLTRDGSVASDALASPDMALVKVPFELGAARFADGDQIQIEEIHGTSGKFEPGNIYWIKGTYTLSSHDKASLSAFTTAKEAKDGTGPIWKVQTVVVKRGSGTFTLFLPMSCEGWPHVSFYTDGGGEGFGGVYFGTGGSVLKKWWDNNEAADTEATNAGQTTDKQRSDEESRKVTIKIDDHQTATAESQPGRLRLQIRRTDAKPSKFPSLEEQKLADLAWKRLRLELEPIDESDLQRVKAQGYDGGLKVTGGPAVNDLVIGQGDILVGLHVWPTTSLEDVADVLNRDDLAELNPVKFYAIRNPNVGRGREAQAIVDDVVVTGRISVNVDDKSNSPANASKKSLTGRDSRSVPAPDHLGSPAVDGGNRKAAEAKREAEAERRAAEQEAKQEAEAAKREAEEKKREAETERSEAEAEARTQAQEGRREAEEAKREAEVEAKQQAEEAHRESEVAKLEAEAQAREGEEIKREAEAQQREVDEQKRAAENAERQAQQSASLEADQEGRVTISLRPQPSADKAHRNDEVRQVVERLKRQLVNTDRQMEMMKRQLEVLAQQKTALVHQAEQLTKHLDEQSRLPDSDSAQPPEQPTAP